jgi:hypothetical protein
VRHLESLRQLVLEHRRGVREVLQGKPKDERWERVLKGADPRRAERLRRHDPDERILRASGYRVLTLIGDLGDRDFERAQIGGLTLWDSVRAAEKELTEKGFLKQKGEVTTDH